MASRRLRFALLSLITLAILIFYTHPLTGVSITLHTSTSTHSRISTFSPPSSSPLHPSQTSISSSKLPHKCLPTISPTDYTPHAIKCRIAHARLRAHNLHNAQSTTPSAAITEYKRRYNRDPPPGFSEWVTFALFHDSKVIDDFDQIDRDLAPFRSAEAQEVFRKLGEKEEWNNIKRVTFVDSVSEEGMKMNTTEKYGYAYGGYWESLVAPFKDKLPNGTTLYMSTIDEPRILAKGGGSGTQPSEILWTDYPGRNLQSLIQESCKQIPLETTGRLGREKDVCQISEPSKVHGFVASPDTFTYTYSLAPVLSIGRMSAFRDILIPCPCYIGHPVLEKDETRFEDKKKSVYWRGSSTGLKNLKGTWRFGHRQRFVAFVQALQNAARVLDSARFFGGKIGDNVDRKQVEVFKGLFDVGMGRYIQCSSSSSSVDDDQSICEEMEKSLGHSSWEEEDSSLAHRYVFDLDGNSMSTRFYRLLSRQSVVVKQTLFQEWHDDRLVPWVHYVPATMEMEELPEVMGFLAGPGGDGGEGERLSGEIAREGERWSRLVLREIDLSIYVYRLLLELVDVFGVGEGF